MYIYIYIYIYIYVCVCAHQPAGIARGPWGHASADSRFSGLQNKWRVFVIIHFCSSGFLVTLLGLRSRRILVGNPLKCGCQFLPVMSSQKE